MARIDRRGAARIPALRGVARRRLAKRGHAGAKTGVFLAVLLRRFRRRQPELRTRQPPPGTGGLQAPGGGVTAPGAPHPAGGRRRFRARETESPGRAGRRARSARAGGPSRAVTHSPGAAGPPARGGEARSIPDGRQSPFHIGGGSRSGEGGGPGSSETSGRNRRDPCEEKARLRRRFEASAWRSNRRDEARLRSLRKLRRVASGTTLSSPKPKPIFGARGRASLSRCHCTESPDRARETDAQKEDCPSAGRSSGAELSFARGVAARGVDPADRSHGTEPEGFESRACLSSSHA